MSFVKWFLDNFIPSLLQIKLDGGKVLTMTAEDIRRVYKLPMGHKLIELACTTVEESKLLFNELGVDRERKGYTENISLKDLYDKLPTYKSTRTWTKAVILCMIGYLLCPPTNMKISMRYAKFVNKLDEIPKFNWCQHVLNHMQKRVGANIKYPTADMHFVMVNFMDKVDGVEGTNTSPSCSNWTKKQLFKRLNNIGDGCGFSRAIEDNLKEKNKLEHLEEFLSDPNQMLLPTNLEQYYKYERWCTLNIKALEECIESCVMRKKELERYAKCRRSQTKEKNANEDEDDDEEEDKEENDENEEAETEEDKRDDEEEDKEQNESEEAETEEDKRDDEEEDKEQNESEEAETEEDEGEDKEQNESEEAETEEDEGEDKEQDESEEAETEEDEGENKEQDESEEVETEEEE